MRKTFGHFPHALLSERRFTADHYCPALTLWADWLGLPWRRYPRHRNLRDSACLRLAFMDSAVMTSSQTLYDPVHLAHALVPGPSHLRSEA